MGDLQLLKLSDGYSSTNSNLLDDFYRPCLEESILYQRAVGYFSSGLLAIAPLAFANFVSRGGKIQIVCSAHLRPEDVDALQNSDLVTSISRDRARQELVELYEKDDLSNALTTAFSSLIGAGILELRLLLPINSNQLFHDKLGIFFDGRQHLSFVGSANETAAAWIESGNHENIEVFRAWNDEADRRRIDRHKSEFQVLWQGPRGWNIVKQNEIKDLVFSVVQPKEVEVSLAEVKEIIEKSKKPKESSNNASPKKEPKKLRSYQSEVLENWESNDKKGIVSFATGGGKTLTAISAIRKWRESGKPTLVLVPSVLLHAQWISEILEEIPNAEIIKFGSGNPLTGREAILREATSRGNAIIVSTYETAGNQKFVSSCSFSSDLLVVADEVHTAGQPEFKKFLDCDFAGPRIGLSATPTRYGDEEGTKRIFEYFGDILEPKFGIQEAIDNGALVPYEYDYLTVPLTEDEFEEWETLSKKISILSAQSDSRENIDLFLKNLLIRRSRIAKNASLKPKIAKETIEKFYKNGDRWLVYCSDTNQLERVKSELASLEIPLLEYHQKMTGDRKTTLGYFGEQGGVMLAIKCLDEGIDIPSINRALILASSTNPREYIQRRGRVLRKDLNKYSAFLWDTLVTTPNGKLLTVAEAHRALEFVETSQTTSARLRLINDVKFSGLEIDLDNIDFEGESENE